MRLQETFRLIYIYRNAERQVPIYDVRHFEERVAERALQDLHIPRQRVVQIIADGAKKIDELWGITTTGSYMLISAETQLKVPIFIQPDRFNPDLLIGGVPTVLFDNDPTPRDKGWQKDVMVEAILHGCSIITVP